MDGYAVRAADAPGSLPLAGRSSAGAPAALGSDARRTRSRSRREQSSPTARMPSCRSRMCASSATGWKWATVVYGDNVRPRGGDVRAGEVVVPAGTLLGAAQIGAAAAAGVAVIACAPRPRVVDRADRQRAAAARATTLSPGEIYESNAALLLVLCRSAGAEVTRFEPVADNEEDTLAALARALEADVVVTTGGVSVGVKDLVRGVLGEARGRGGVLARRRSARQAGGLRGPRRDAGVRPARQSGVVAGGVRAVRPARPARAAGCRARAVLPSGPPRRHAAPQRCARRSRPRDAPRRRRSSVAQAAVGPVLPHDRAGGCGRRARPGSARRGRARPGSAVRYLRL